MYEGDIMYEDGINIYEDGSKEWYLDGELHRLDGPACEYSDGTKEWAINGILLTEEQFKEKCSQVILS
jgi:hypothetical protein